MIAAKRHWTMKPARSNQPVYLKKYLDFKWKSNGMFLWERDYAFIYMGNERLWI